MKFESICVLGLGYIGLPTASTFAARGMRVTGVDVNMEVVRSLQNGQAHIHEPGLRELVQQAVGSGRLVVQDKPAEADAFIIAVPTPFHEDKSADLSAVVAAAESIVPVLRRGNLVVLESTSPPRTTLDVVVPILERSGLKAGQDFHLTYSPERVLPGQIIRELSQNARVVGGVDRASAEAARDLYGTFVTGEIVLTDATTAEMVKLMENTYRDINIAIANEFSRLAERFGVDIWEAIDIANRHPRVKILNPGPGVGGHCISVDPWFLVKAAPDITPLIETARRVNDDQPLFVVDRIRAMMDGDLRGRRIAVLGLAFKPDVDDLRESPAVKIVELLVQAGAQVSVFEPMDDDFTLPGVRTAKTLAVAVADCELVLLLVGHAPFRKLLPGELATITTSRLIFDAVNALEPQPWAHAGFDLHRLGASRI